MNVCKKCKHKWQSRVKKPRSCPNCKRYDWDKKSLAKLLDELSEK